MYVVHRNTLSHSFLIRIVCFQPKQDSDRIRISFFKNRLGSDSENPLSDHLCGVILYLNDVTVGVARLKSFRSKYSIFRSFLK